MEDKKLKVVLFMIVAGVFLILLGLGMIPTNYVNHWGWSPRIAVVSEFGVLVIVLALIVAWKWNPDTLK